MNRTDHPQTKRPLAPPSAHIKLTPAGAACLFGAGAFANMAVLGIAAVAPDVALTSAAAAGVLLAAAWTSARLRYPTGMYARTRFGFVWRPSRPEPVPPRPVDLDELAAHQRNTCALARLAASGGMSSSVGGR